MAMSKRIRRRSHTTKVYLSDDEYSFVSRAARQKNRSVSSLMRESALRQLDFRPTLSARERIRKRSDLRLSLTASERDVIYENSRRAGLTMSDYIRERCCYERQTFVDRSVFDSNTLAINRVGVNLNQIARRLNACQDESLSSTIDSLSADLDATLSDVRAVMAETSLIRKGPSDP